jgi:hypothetical protein
MAYTPPGVYTEVEIANNIVQLPGGTRIPAFIGTGRKYLSIAGETQTQATNRLVTLSNIPVRSIDNIYDFSGSGGALTVYPSSGNGAYGSGWYQSGNQVAWTSAANEHPASTTPQIGDSYFATYVYTGISFTGAGLFNAAAAGSVLYAPTLSGTAAGSSLLIPNVETILNVYSGNSTSSGSFPATGISASGDGWFQSGSSLIWTNGSATDFAASSGVGTVPASGATYYVAFTYTGTVFGQTFTQTSAYENDFVFTGAIASGDTVVSGVVAVSGSATTYPASGTVSGTDSSGYGIDDSGWYLSGTSAPQSLAWNPVNPSAYGYPPSTVVPISGVFYIDYTYDKSSTDYEPKNFTDYTQVVSEYGPDAEWTLVTTGTNAGSYDFASLNPLTLASRLAFANGASIVSLTQMSGNGLTTGEFQNALNQLQAKTIDVIVPLTVGSGASLTEISIPTKSSILSAVDIHCQTMSLPQNKKERVSIGSLGVAEIGDVDTENTYVYTASEVLSDKRIALVAPGKCLVEIQDPNGEFQQVEVDGAFMAVAASALSCNPNFDVATPLTNKQFVGFDNISARTADHPNSEYLESEKNILAAAGVFVIDRTGSRIFVRHQLTTDQTNVAVGEFSVVTTTDYVSQAVRYTTEQFIGKKLINAIVVPAVKSTILATMQQLIQAAIINAVGAITVQVDPNNPTQILSTVQYVPVFPLNRIKVTFTIRTQL